MCPENVSRKCETDSTLERQGWLSLAQMAKRLDARIIDYGDGIDYDDGDGSSTEDDTDTDMDDDDGAYDEDSSGYCAGKLLPQPRLRG